MLRKSKTNRAPVIRPTGLAASNIEALESRTLLSAASDIIIQPNIQISAAASKASSIQGYTPAQIRAAYGFTGVSGDGSGQTIAIIDAYNDPNIAADLNTFDSEFGLAAANLSVVSQTGGSVKGIATDAGWAGEISLDVEWAHSIAPGAKILLVEASSDSLSSLLSAVNYARGAAGVSVVSMSWGGSEFSGETQYDNYFTTPSGHQGVTFVASAGDSGASSAEWPAASPNVLSVGGTTLNLSSTGAYQSESAWSDGGGGTSTVETAPSFQSAVTSSSARTTPDVSYDADPNTGFAIYDSLNDDGYVGWQEVGGTSAGAPQWSALIALADQARVANGQGTLDGPTGTLPTLYSVYSSPTSSTYATYTSIFNDITTGTSGGFGGGGYFYGRWGGGGGYGGVSATAGYDEVTGLGTPKAAEIVSALEGLSNRAAARAMHAAHVARKLAKASHLRGAANPGITNVITQSSSSSLSGAAVANAVGPLGHLQLDGGSETLTVQGDAASDMSTASPSTGHSITGNAETASQDFQPNISGGSRFAGIFAVGQASSLSPVAAGSAGSSPASESAMLDVAAPGARDIVTGSIASLANHEVELMSLTPPIAFADATTAFADECAALPAMLPSRATSIPWMVAAGVLGFNAVLIGYWAANRKGKRKTAQVLG